MSADSELCHQTQKIQLVAGATSVAYNASMGLNAFSHFHPFSSHSLKTAADESSVRSSGALMYVADNPGDSSLRKRVLQLLVDMGPLSTRAIGWHLRISYETAKEELLTLQKEGLVFVSS